MNKINILFLLLLISNIVFAQKKKKQAPNQKDVLPPGCIWVEKDNMSFWIDQTEVANIHWQEFLADLQKNNPEMYDKMLPNAKVWKDEKLIEKMTNDSIVYRLHHNSLSLDDIVSYGYSQSYTINYFNHLGFRFFPVVGISYEQAQAYCKWRSRVVTENFNLRKKSKKLQNYKIEINYRLPTEQEWELAAQGNTNNEYGFCDLDKKEKIRQKKYDIEQVNASYLYKKEKRLEYYSQANTCDYLKPQLIPNKIYMEASLTEDIYAYPPNDFGVYNMIGNVAEMVQEKGIAKGGSWLDHLENCSIKKHKTYEKPNAWLGFRCVCEVKITKIEQL